MPLSLNHLKTRHAAWQTVIVWLIFSILGVQSYGHLHRAEHFQIAGGQSGWLSQAESTSSHASQFHDCHLLDAVTMALGPVARGLAQAPMLWGDQLAIVSVTGLLIAKTLAVTPPARAPPLTVLF